jgi:hypothetical protein
MSSDKNDLLIFGDSSPLNEVVLQTFHTIVKSPTAAAEIEREVIVTISSAYNDDDMPSTPQFPLTPDPFRAIGKRPHRLEDAAAEGNLTAIATKNKMALKSARKAPAPSFSTQYSDSEDDFERAKPIRKTSKFATLKFGEKTEPAKKRVKKIAAAAAAASAVAVATPPAATPETTTTTTATTTTTTAVMSALKKIEKRSGVDGIVYTKLLGPA